ncbi:cytochrome c biogenesis protein ResB [Curvibacter sp. CHRR-16]|uniref:cytochrome c biogenesis protein ResB n=1 Tax=Curvibacter sp. CHRR-16 TaxID=2835872 RepID=UPI001BD9A6A5|nr:cytochrome c biogenesis protein ResB [Curvibacter sp. CHRR-16]MBT0569461.1 cytochrome c biogenesis protein ResB [Curvibacter sp. CHRR-16]
MSFVSSDSSGWLERPRAAWRSVSPLLSSMRFAVALLTLICIASVVGTLIKQHEPMPNYINQFGPFWAEVFDTLSLYSIYSSWWFLLILGFLVLSTGLCLWRNTPKFLRDARSYKEHIRLQSLRAFGHRYETHVVNSSDQAAYQMVQSLAQRLQAQGWQFKAQQRAGVERETQTAAHGVPSGYLLAAKKGGLNKWGYVAAHGAIIMVCVGGLLDSDLVIRAQTLLAGKTPYRGGGFVADVPQQHRLPLWNPTYRGNLVVAENTQSGTAVLAQKDGVLLQDLPFAVELKKFQVDYYSTGMPKLFASDILIHDGGKTIPARVEVNHPFDYNGVQIYQSSFEDGGSSLQLQAIPLDGRSAPFALQGRVGASTRVSDELTVEYTDLRVINVERLGEDPKAANDSQHAIETLQDQLGAASRKSDKQLRNLGPSVTYKLRDGLGQAREFQNYMAPVQLDDGTVPVYLFGMRTSEQEGFRYLRVPTDAAGSMDSFWRLHAAINNPALRSQAVQRYVHKALESQKASVQAQLGESASKVLALFAGEGAPAGTAGLQAVSDFIEHNVPQAERNKAGDVLIRILNGVVFELQQLALEKAHQATLPLADERTQAYMTQAVLALSDVPVYQAPFVLVLQDFQQVQASVFQVTRSPGKWVVYIGCALLIVGVFAMLYVRERRLWLWAGADGQVLLAYSSNRKTMGADHEFAHWVEAVQAMEGVRNA